MSIDRDFDAPSAASMDNSIDTASERVLPEAESGEPSYLLTQLEVFNWGPFWACIGRISIRWVRRLSDRLGVGRQRWSMH